MPVVEAHPPQDPWTAAQELGRHAPGFAGWQDEPPQMASGSAGKTGYLNLVFERRAERTILAELALRSPYMAQRALYPEAQAPDLAWLFVITTSGCVLQGDRMALDVTARPGARAHVTTQSATKLHGMDANYATQTQTLTVEDGAYLEYLPEPLIPHRGARYMSDTRISVAASATLLYGEILQPGRKHHHPDEVFGASMLSLATTATRPDGTLLFHEKLVIEPARQPMRRTGVMDGFDVFANAVLVTPPDNAARVLARLDTDVDHAAGVAFGACRLPNDAGLVYKVVGRETAQVKAKLREFWSAAREDITGAALGPPFFWR